MSSPHVTYQPSLFDSPGTGPSFDREFRGVQRIALDETSWIDHGQGWVTGADQLFTEVMQTRDWGQRSRWMYTQKVREPRLTAPWSLDSGVALTPPILETMRQVLSRRYGVVFDSIGFNLYRDGHDSVAWHSDRILKEVHDPIVVLVSLGEPRKFQLRPKGGGRSLSFMLGAGDLLVTGGQAQRKWDHCVPKVAKAGPRISLAYRHGLDPRAYDHKTVEPAEP